jgi:hypothetical protein
VAQLSLTAGQTIFAIPIFDFKNAWMDMRFRPAAASYAGGSLPNSNLTVPHTSTATAAETAGAGDNPVLSGYFWIYLGVALGLTSLTFLLFFSVVRSRREIPPNVAAWPGEIRTMLTDEVFTQEMQAEESDAVSSSGVTRGDYASSRLHSVLEWLRESWARFRGPKKI